MNVKAAGRTSIQIHGFRISAVDIVREYKSYVLVHLGCRLPTSVVGSIAHAIAAGTQGGPIVRHLIHAQSEG